MPKNNLENNNEAPESSRREFLKHTGIVLAGVAATSLLPAAAQTQTTSQQTQINPNSKGIIDLGPITDYKANSITDKTKDTNAYISNTKNGLIALVAICTHNGCKPNIEPANQDFVCRCHGATFANDGAVTARPARTPLAQFALTISKDSHLMMDTTKYILRRSVQATDFLKV